MEEKLIIAVAGFPVIYDLSLFAYRDINKKNDAWTKVSEIVGVPDPAWTATRVRDMKHLSIPSLCGDSASDQQHQPIKRRRMLGPGEQQGLVVVCDTNLMDAKERFSFTQHLISATLLHGELFPQHSVKFPDAALETTVEAYPMLNKAKLKTELSLIYENSEFKASSGAVPLYQFSMENKLKSTFSETVSLLKILITTPMTTAESERCFSTLKRIKTS
ncbi:uncharacterized protein LOC127432047 isoform X2 [Myxocyprinus asiaticus]|uniref:uncharacterized protein LOC127432047 isoform X2 n=1 Tax=Myxocyprinus asiaticus TaxID=70543 RepID=UPI00222186A6|nr:uncharacterized protein LOC127432047 isoform X2 [Myxocyprinus asiaticus]